jgi:hypothetical protein
MNAGSLRWSVALLVACSALAHAQRPVTQTRQVPLADTVEHSPFIPGGHWRPGPPAPVPASVYGPVAGAPSAVTDSAGYFARPNGMLLRTGTTVYQLTLRRDTVLVPLGIRTVTVSDTMLAGVRDWLIAESRTGTAITTSDSLHLRRADLTPMRWTARNGVSQLAVSFTKDSMFTALQDYQGRGSFADALPPGALITPGMVDRLLELLPLGPGYQAGASIVVIDSGVPHSVPAMISVEGEDIVTLTASSISGQGIPVPTNIPPTTVGSQVVAPQSAVPQVMSAAVASPVTGGSTLPQQTIVNQRAECWVVVLRAGSIEKRYWVAKSPQRVVKTERQIANGTVTELLRVPMQ